MTKKLIKLFLTVILSVGILFSFISFTTHASSIPINVGINDSDKNDKGEYIPGLFFSIGRVIQNEDDLEEFIKEFYQVEYTYEIQSHMNDFYNTFCSLQNGYVVSFKIVYIQNRINFEKWLVDVGKKIDDFTYDIKLFITFLNTYKGYYLLDLQLIPGYFYSIDSGNIIFTKYIYPIVSNGIFSYIDNSTFDCPSTVCSFDELDNCIGKFEQVSADEYKYIYTSFKFDSKIGYYIDKNSEVSEINMSKKDLPSIVMGNDGNLLSCYIAVKDKHFLRPIVKEKKSTTSFNYFIREEYYYTTIVGPHDSGNDFYFFVAYLNFDVPIDVILKINFKYGYYKQNILRKKFYTATASITCNTKVNSDLSGAAMSISYPSGYELAIQKSDYKITTKKYGDLYYDFRIVLSDDNYKPSSFALEEAYCSYPDNYHPTKSFEICYMEYLYDSIIFTGTDLSGSTIQEIIYPSKFDKFMDGVDNFFANFKQNIKKILLIIVSIILMIISIRIISGLLKKKKQA